MALNLKQRDWKKIAIVLALIIVFLAAATGGAIADRVFGIKPLDYFFPSTNSSIGTNETRTIKESSDVINVVKKVSPSVVTVSIQTPQRSVLQFNPFSGFSRSLQGGDQQDIGTGFIVSSDGLIVTNKHVVSDTTSTYKVVTNDNKEYKVTKISRDPANDIAILKIDAAGLTPIELGNSDNLQVGQFVIAIGTALGQFRNTVTTGVISGLGRGIQAGNPLQGYVEKLDNIIQTDAAINPGNSGGPLLDADGKAIGIDVAVAQNAQNIGFAIPINVVKTALSEFNSSGGFPAKAFLGVEYQLVSQSSAILNSVPQGAYVVSVVANSPAEKAGIQTGDIITKFDGQNIDSSNSLADLIAKKKAGDNINLEVWRNSNTQTVSVTLGESSQ